MEMQEKETRKEALRREMYTYLSDMQTRCENLLAARDPFSVYNSVQPLRSLVGQLDSAARRYRNLA